jgi:hypothetical protein
MSVGNPIKSGGPDSLGRTAVVRIGVAVVLVPLHLGLKAEGRRIADDSEAAAA